jgi:hypothetical protein
LTSRALRRIFEPKRGRNVHNEELHNVYSLPNIFRMIRSRRIRWAEHVACMGRRVMDAESWWESQKERETTRKT